MEPKELWSLAALVMVWYVANLGFNVGMKSRFDDIVFSDYGFDELKEIWDKLLLRYSGDDVCWRVEDDNVLQVAVRRVARGKDRHGFDMLLVFIRAGDALHDPLHESGL